MRLIDADALIQKRNHAKNYSPDMYVIGQGYVMDAPTISAVPVVRGECKNFKLYPDGEGTHYGQCLCWMVGGIDDDDYCSYGEKKEDNTD